MTRIRILALATTVAASAAFFIAGPAKAIPVTGQMSIGGANTLDYSAHTLIFLPGTVVGNTATVTGSFLAAGFDAGDPVTMRQEGVAIPYLSPLLAAGSNLTCGGGCIFTSDSNGPAPGGNIVGFNIVGGYSVVEVANNSLSITANGILTLTGFDPTPGTFFYSTQAPGSTVTFSATSVAVPGPVVGAGLPGLIAACGGLLMLARRRRKLA